MPIGILTDDELEIELNKSVSNTTALVVNKIPVGRPVDRPNIPDVVKKIVGEASLEGASTKELSALFNISQPTINASAMGFARAGANAPINDELNSHVNKIKDKIKTRASNKLLNALREITPDKLSSASARDNSAIAKDMSHIIRNMDDAPAHERDGKGVSNAAQFIFFAPAQKSIEAYDVVEVVD